MSRSPKTQVGKKNNKTNYDASDTHTEDVKAHSSFNPFLVGEVIPGELVDRCRVNTHKDEQM